MEILSTKEYDKFEIITGNRNINLKKVEKICGDIKNGLNLLPYCPVIVYEDEGKFNLVDGQHRYNVSKKLNMPVYYVVCDEISLHQIATINSKQDKWTTKDFLKCYIKLGNEHYITLENLLKEHKVQITTAVELLMTWNPQKRVSGDDFRSGKFKVNHLKETQEILSLADDLFGRYVFTYDRNLLTALIKIKSKGKCDFETLKEKIKSVPNMMDKQTTTKNYIYIIERIYNHNNRQRQVIF